MSYQRIPLNELEKAIIKGSEATIANYKTSKSYDVVRMDSDVGDIGFEDKCQQICRMMDIFKYQNIINHKQ